MKRVRRGRVTARPRLGNAIMSLAQAQATLDDVLEYTQQREQFGKPLIDFQVPHH